MIELQFQCILWIHSCNTIGYTMTKSAALRIRIAPELHQEFLDVCQLQDLSASHVLRQFMRSYINQKRKEQQSELFIVNDRSGDCT